MEINVKNGSLNNMEGAICILGVFEEEVAKGVLFSMDRALEVRLRNILSSEGFTGKFLQTILVRPDGKIGFQRLILVGLGKRSELTAERVRQAVGRSAPLVQKMGLDSISILCVSKLLGKGGAQQLAQAIVEGLLLSLYRFDRLKTDKKDKKEIKECTLLVADKKEIASVKKGALQGKVLAQGVCYTRDLCSLPSNMVTPTYLSNEAIQLGKETGMSVEVLERDEIKATGMGAFHAVALGTDEPPKFIIIHYKGAGKGKKRPVALIGKSVTFDTGGISLKPSGNMEQMKYDMSGGATVLGTMKVVSQLKLPIDIVAILPATDNMPSGKAVHPGDVVTTLSGKTVEIINTDAEGRLCLADALTYATRFKPSAMIDLATLTGACVVALGQHAMGLMGNNARLTSRIRLAGEAVTERTWELPLWDDYFNQIEGDVADLKNVGGRGGGTITAGLFLKQFVGEVPWVHLDIAGTSWFNDGKHPYIPKGATGIGVRLLIQYLTQLSEQKKK